MAYLCQMKVCKEKPGMCIHEKMMLAVVIILVIIVLYFILV